MRPVLQSISLCLLVLTTACDSELDSTSDLDGIRARFSASAYVFKNGDEERKRMESLPPGNVYVAVIKQFQSTDPDQRLAFALGGTQDDASKVLKGLGLTLPNAEISYEDLMKYNVTEQPNLYAAKLGDTSLVSGFYRVIDESPPEQGKTPSSGYYIRFLGDSRQLYSVGCLELVTALGQKLDDSVPVLKASLPAIAGSIGKQDKFPEINCNPNNTTDLPAPKPASPSALPGLDPVRLEVYKTRLSTPVFSNNEMRTYIVSTSKGKKLSYASNCELLGLSDDYFKAFGFNGMPDNIPEVFDRNSPLFKGTGIDEQPLFQCYDSEEGQREQLSEVFRTTNTKENYYYARFKGQKERDKIYRLGCSAMVDFFALSSSAEHDAKIINITAQTIPHLVSKGDDVIDIPCARMRDPLISASGGTVLANGENTSNYEFKENAFDTNLHTKWLVNSSQGWIQYSFPKQTAYVVTSYSLSSANDFPQRDPRDWILKGSNDGINWTIIDHQNNEAFTDRFQTKHYDVSNTQAFKTYVLDIKNSGSVNLQLSEFSLFGFQGNSSSDPQLKVSNYVPSSLESPVNETIDSLFDGKVDTKWLVNSKSAWIEFGFSAPQTKLISMYSVVSGNDAPGRDPTDWSLKGSDDGVNWTTLDERKDQSFAHRKQEIFYTLANRKPFQKYRLDILSKGVSTCGCNALQISELRFHGISSYQ